MPENLALAYQEVFTAIDRLRAGRQVPADAGLFRQQIRDALSTSEKQSRALGYSSDEIRLATFAIVAFLDSSVLSVGSPVFRDWPKKPLQEELFGSFNAGEIFFTNIQRLLQQPDSAGLADLLEIYLLCMLLGFEGRYNLGGQGELRSVRESLAERIRRIRGLRGDLSPDWKPPVTQSRNLSDPLVRNLGWTAAVCAGLAIVLFVLYKFLLHAGVSEVAALAGHV